jgi:TRAP-type mannitol/chloroaromatic compound transport system permease small subunit
MGITPSTLNRIAARLDWLSGRIGQAVAWLTLAMVLVTFAVVVLRYAFDLGWIAMQESVTFMHALVFMLAAAWTLRHDGHVRVDIFYREMTPKARARVDLAGTLFLLLPVSVFILVTSWDYVAAAWSLREGSREAGGLPGVYLLKTAIPVMAGLLILQGIANALRAVAVLRGAAGPAAEERHTGV